MFIRRSSAPPEVPPIQRVLLDSHRFLSSISLTGRRDGIDNLAVATQSVSSESDEGSPERFYSIESVIPTSRLTHAQIQWCTPGGTAFGVSSIIPYSGQQKRTRKHQGKSGTVVSVEDRTRNGTVNYLTEFETPPPSYDPDELDDPTVGQGKHRQVFRRPSYLLSITLYVQKDELKDALNDRFRERFPEISLTLSKLRSLKRDMLRIGLDMSGLDISTLAFAYVYYEKLVLGLHIDKPNRKIYAACCLLFAIKFNTPADELTERSASLFRAVEEIWGVLRRQVIAVEWTVFVALGLTLNAESGGVRTHMARIQAIRETEQSAE